MAQSGSVRYTPLWLEYAGRTYAETQAKIYQRGVSFGQAMCSVYPDIPVWLLYGYSHIVQNNPPLDLSDVTHGLYAAFIDGMMSGTDSGSIIIDGCEGAYRFVDTSEFAALGSVVTNTALSYTADPALYSQKIRVGFGLYMDQYRYESSHPWYSDSPEDNYMTPASLEYRLSNAISQSDGYIWIYSEIPSWWLTSASDTFPAGVTVMTGLTHGWVDPVYSQAMENALNVAEMCFTDSGDLVNGQGDRDGDCRVTLTDWAIFGSQWQN